MPTLKTLGGRKTSTHQQKKKTDPFYYSTRWRKLRRHKLNQQPLCEITLQQTGMIVKAEMVDHWKPRRLWPELELDLTNLVSMCHKVHNHKRAIEKNCNTREQWHKEFDNHKIFKR